MKSSGPLFTKKNPFPPASTLKKTHYHPSRTQELSKKEKKTTLSPVRSNQLSSSQLNTLSPEFQQLYKKRDHHSSAFDGQPDFTESWPSTDCDSPPGSNAILSDMEAPKLPVIPGKSTVSSTQGVQQDSVLAKYVERFRYGHPCSREERLQMTSAPGEEEMPSWWLSPSSLPPSSTPTKTTDKDSILPLDDDHDPGIFSPAGQRQHDGSFSPYRVSGEFDDAEIIQLQERASRLLLSGSEDHDGSIPVSSEGLGSSDFSFPIIVDEPVRRHLIPSLIKPVTAKASSDSVHDASSQKYAIPSLVSPTRPEEDILFQWRLQKKMEKARDCAQSLQTSTLNGTTFGWQVPSLKNPTASGQAYKQQQPPQFSQIHLHATSPHLETSEAQRSLTPAPDPHPLPAFVDSGSSLSQPQTIAHVPPHMHLLCDVLPCPIQSPHAGAQQNISQMFDKPETKVVHKKTQFPLGKSMSCSPSASSRAVEGEWPSQQTIPERNKSKKVETKESEQTAMAIRDQKVSPRSSSHQRLPKKVTSKKEQHRRKGNQGFASGSCSGDHEPPSSPIHRVLGQVVSEVLFPTVDSDPAPRNPVSPPHSVSAPSQSPVLPCNVQNSMEVVSQLLREAEDSDEKEFEDDPLLQVLRKQKKWVKEQIREVDSVLNEILEEQQVT